MNYVIHTQECEEATLWWEAEKAAFEKEGGNDDIRRIGGVRFNIYSHNPIIRICNYSV